VSRIDHFLARLGLLKKLGHLSPVATDYHVRYKFLSVAASRAQKPLLVSPLQQKSFGSTKPSLQSKPLHLSSQPSRFIFPGTNTLIWYLRNAAPSTNCTLSLGDMLKIF
jgi:hypothetical protein